MYFDRKWWGIHNMDWTGYYLRSGKYLPVDKLLDKECFFGYDCAVTYPIVGAFTDWLISRWGMERYLQLFRKKNIPAAMAQVYGKTPEQMNRDFVRYVSLFKTDDVLERRMEALLAE